VCWADRNATSRTMISSVRICFLFVNATDIVLTVATSTDEGLAKLGFKPYLPAHLRGPIITTFKFPNDKNWSFKTFYDELNKLDLVIYPGKVTNGRWTSIAKRFGPLN